MEQLVGWVEDQGGRVYKEWKHKLHKYYEEHGPGVIPAEFDVSMERKLQWKWLTEHFESPQFKVEAITISTTITNESVSAKTSSLFPCAEKEPRCEGSAKWACNAAPYGRNPHRTDCLRVAAFGDGCTPHAGRL